ncbi:MAG: terpene cyclase/mutase family protein, partial [Planctomycetes bacterium]|nr:terpene cyclase/mutase family protein [Planctomycetota bacterium]
ARPDCHPPGALFFHWQPALRSLPGALHGPWIRPGYADWPRSSKLPATMYRFSILLLACLSLLAPFTFPQEGSAPVPQKAIDNAIDRGMEYLIEDQDLDGSWRYHTDRHRAGITGLCVYTLLKGGLTKNHQSVQRGLRFLDVCEIRTTYEAACMVLAYSEADAQHYRKRLQEIVDEIVDWNQGTWAYPDGEKDLSNTHFGVLALIHAHRLQLSVPDKLWKKIGTELMRWQSDYGGFPYRPGGASTPSMTAAGTGLACMVREAARDLGNSHKLLAGNMDKVIEEGLRWFQENYRLHERPWPGNADKRQWDFYYLYALQRVGMLTPAPMIAGHDWYQDGASWLVKNQGAKGAWSTAYGEKQPNTCLAILFLVRASGPTTGERAGGKNVFRTEDPESNMVLLVSGDSPMSVWIESFHTLIKDSYEWPDEQDKGLHVEKVEYWVDGELKVEVEGKPKLPSGNERFPARLLFDGPGKHEIVAVVRLQSPPGSQEPVVELRSTPLAFEVTSGLLPEMIEAVEDHRRNLLRQTRVRCEVSSQISDKWKGQFAADGLMGRGWACAENDKEPMITLELDDAQRGNVLLFTHARETGHEPNFFARAQAIEVQVNKAKWVRVQMDPDETKKTRLVLDRSHRVRRISVRFLDLVPGDRYPHSVGVMEIELQSDKDAK